MEKQKQEGNKLIEERIKKHEERKRESFDKGAILFSEAVRLFIHYHNSLK